MGPGPWRGNPAYASNKNFLYNLSARLWKVLKQDRLSNTNTQLLWEEIKMTTKQCIRSFRIKHASWRKSSLKLLEKKKNRSLRPKLPTGI
ncbi:uncharacterized protein BX663DRAFT_566619, partial [Cokeromyces recurvatus]|uniref:uncharacterized protein n=1 Tax=Cokeromyces recurvatus TaxID=90255 RepID=UPI00221EE734